MTEASKSLSALEERVRRTVGATYERRIQRTSLLLVPPKRSPCCLGITEHLRVHARPLPEREVWKAGPCPFLPLEDDVKRKKVGSSGLKPTDWAGVMSSALLKLSLISGTTGLRDGGGLEKADFSFPSSSTPLSVSGTELGLKAVTTLSNKAGSSVAGGLTGSPVAASTSGDAL